MMSDTGASQITLARAVLCSIAIACSAAPEPDADTSGSSRSRGVASAQAAYVWQRNWTPAVRAAVARPPAGIDGLRVLAAEVQPDGRIDPVAVDTASLATARLPITLVMRLEGSRPIAGLGLSSVVQLAERLRGSGVEVTGIEVDHDCASAGLATYARWLREHRPAGYRFSITALPAWAMDDAEALRRVAAAVDEIVVQVHAVRTPVIFDAQAARRDLARFSRAVRGVPIQVALPTYRAVVRSVEGASRELGVTPDEVEPVVTSLIDRPLAGVVGVVWFRLPVEGDDHSWTRDTFAAVVARLVDPEHVAGQRSARVELVAHGGDRFDVVVSNDGDTRVELPPLRVMGHIAAADMVMGYREQGNGQWKPPHRSLDAKQRVVVGWIHGKDVSLVD